MLKKTENLVQDVVPFSKGVKANVLWKNSFRGDLVIWSFSGSGLILSGRVGLEFLDSSPGKRIEH